MIDCDSAIDVISVNLKCDLFVISHVPDQQVNCYSRNVVIWTARKRRQVPWMEISVVCFSYMFIHICAWKLLPWKLVNNVQAFSSSIYCYYAFNSMPDMRGHKWPINIIWAPNSKWENWILCAYSCVIGVSVNRIGHRNDNNFECGHKE